MIKRILYGSAPVRAVLYLSLPPPAPTTDGWRRLPPLPYRPVAWPRHTGRPVRVAIDSSVVGLPPSPLASAPAQEPRVPLLQSPYFGGV